MNTTVTTTAMLLAVFSSTIAYAEPGTPDEERSFARMRAESRLKYFENLHAKESVDSSWRKARALQGMIADVAERHTSASVDCRQTVCRVDAYWPRDPVLRADAAQTLRRYLVTSEPCEFYVPDMLAQRGESARLVVFVRCDRGDDSPRKANYASP